MSPSGTRSSHIVGGMVAGGPVCPSSTSVSYFGQSCNIRSTYVMSVYSWMLCSARVRAWARSFYSVHCWGVGLGGWVSVCSGSSAFIRTFLWPTVCAAVYSSSPHPGVQSEWTSPKDAVVGLQVAVRA